MLDAVVSTGRRMKLKEKIKVLVGITEKVACENDDPITIVTR